VSNGNNNGKTFDMEDHAKIDDAGYDSYVHKSDRMGNEP
jgi:hypothetical protein